MYPHERSLVERMKDKPFALIGVNSDVDKKKLRIGDELMIGMAASGNPEAVKYVLDIAKLEKAFEGR